MENSEDITLNLKKYSEINNQIKELEKQKDKLKTEILIFMKLAGTSEYRSETHSARYTMMKRKVLDKNALDNFLSLHDKDYESFQNVNEYEMLKIIEIGSREESE